MTSTTSMPGSMASASSGMLSGMSSSFNVNNFATTLYSTDWMPTTPAGYAGSWLFLCFLAFIWRGLIATLLKLDAYWTRKHETYSILVDGGKERVDRKQTVEVWRTSVNLPRAALTTVIQGIAYLLMIAVMTMNVGFFFAVLVGYFMGELSFKRLHAR
ncbi:hypothetical protein MMC26_004246 [Xylographa opegraphella]|nr:hypothetical protein [Xylographa opegraphella]